MKTLGISLLLLFLMPAAAEATPLRVNYTGTVYETRTWSGADYADGSFYRYSTYSPVLRAITGWFDIDLITGDVSSSVGIIPDALNWDSYTFNQYGFEIADVNTGMGMFGPESRYQYLSTFTGLGSIQIAMTATLEDGTFLYNTLSELFYVDSVWTGVPEPTTLALLGLGLVGMGLRRRKVA